LHQDCYCTEEAVPLRYLKAVKSWGVEDDGRGCELFVHPDSESSLKDKLKDPDRSKPIMLLAPGAGRATKRWLPERFSEVGTHFSEQGYQVILMGGEQDRPISKEVGAAIPNLFADLCGKLSLQESLALVQKARILITNDTGVMHMASALQTPVVALFGPTTRPLGFFPFRATSQVIEKELNCRPCSYHGTDRCPKDHFRCMRDIESEEVINTAETLLKRGSA
jgi:heptosyltransferase-2